MSALEAFIAAARGPGAQADAAKAHVARACADSGVDALCADLAAALAEPQAKASPAELGRAVCHEPERIGCPLRGSQYRMRIFYTRPATGAPGTQDTLSLLLQATRPAAADDPAVAAACAGLRAHVAPRLAGWLHALPPDQGPRVKELVLVVMAELEHLTPVDRKRLAASCLSGLEEARNHAAAVLELLPPCLLLIPPEARDGSGSGRSVADAVEGEAAPLGTPPLEPSLAHRCDQ
jgi:hypothetical protein